MGMPACWGISVLCSDTEACLQAAQTAKRAEEAQDRPAAAEGVPQLVDELDDVDPNQYHERRLRGLLAAKAEGRNPYPHKFQVSTYLPAFVAQYSGLEAGARLEETVSVAGEGPFCLSACPLCTLLHQSTSLPGGPSWGLPAQGASVGTSAGYMVHACTCM